MRIAKGTVNIKAPAEVVQIALKGLLSHTGVDTPQSYYFDRPRLKAFQKTPEGRNLSGLIININYLKLDIISTSRETTSLSYEVETRGWKSPIAIMLFVESGILFLIGLMVQLVTSFLPLAILSCAMAIIILLITLFLVIPTEKKVEKFFHKLLLPRLDRYIDIINEHIER